MSLVVVAVTLLAGGRAGAADTDPPAGRLRIDVVQLGGLLDPVNVAHLRHALDEAAGSRSPALVLVQLDSRATTASEGEVRRLLGDMTGATVPVAVWVGPAGSGRALSSAADVLAAADHAGMAPGTTVEGPDGRRLDADAALAAGVVQVVSPTLADFIGRLDGQQLKGVTVRTATPRVEGEPFQLSDQIEIRFRKPGLVDRTLHALGSPSAVLFLLVLGLLLFLFELFSAGIGIAAGTAAVSLALAAYGLGSIGVQPLGLALLVLATFGFGVDIQTGVPRLWTGIGTVALVLGSLLSFPPDLRPGWLGLLLVDLGALAFVLFGIPATVRTRFSTPTIGRSDLIGAKGVALTALDPDGTVEVRGAPWRAKTFPAAIAAGAAVEVISIDGLVLEVVPEGTELLPPRR